MAPKADEIPTEKFFLDANNLPPGSNITMDTTNDVIQGILPQETCSMVCPSGAIVINGSENTAYIINGMSATYPHRWTTGSI